MGHFPWQSLVFFEDEGSKDFQAEIDPIRTNISAQRAATDTKRSLAWFTSHESAEGWVIQCLTEWED